MDISQLESYIVPGKRVHVVGIGGVSMCALADVLYDMGIIVTGSDLNDGAAVRRLADKGVKIHLGHNPENIAGADMVVRTAAVHDDNAEIIAARKAGIPVFERAEVWGYLMKSCKASVCVSGTHGKTSTTSMVTHMALSAKMNPTVMIGGFLPLLGAGHRVGSGELFIMEACEYCNSFLNFLPTIAIILNIDADHLDFFKDLDDIKVSFRKFAGLVPKDGFLIVNADDKNAMEIGDSADCRVVTYGLSEGVDITAGNIVFEKGYASFDVYNHGAFYTRVSLHVPGIHNVSNALAATAAMIELGAPPEAVVEGLKDFHGAGRRFDFKGTYKGIPVYDDYAHHPTEVSAALKAARGVAGNGRVILVFQPHTYSRTKALFDDFVRELGKADLVVMTDIYAAREINTIGISSKDLAERIPDAQYCATFEEAVRFIDETARPGDVIITMGAGDIYKIGEALVKAKN